MRRTVGWSSMTRILGALRTSGRVTVAAKRVFDCRAQSAVRRPPGTAGEVSAILYLVGPRCHCDADHTELLSLGSTLPAILEPGAALIVLGAG